MRASSGEIAPGQLTMKHAESFAPVRAEGLSVEAELNGRGRAARGKQIVARRKDLDRSQGSEINYRQNGHGNSHVFQARKDQMLLELRDDALMGRALGMLVQQTMQRGRTGGDEQPQPKEEHQGDGGFAD